MAGICLGFGFVLQQKGFLGFAWESLANMLLSQPRPGATFHIACANLINLLLAQATG
jgi:hypothetical protein